MSFRVGSTPVGSEGPLRCPDAHERVMWHVYRARHLANEHEPLSEKAASHHDAIVQAIVTGNAAAAERAMREHLLDVSRIVTGEGHPLASGSDQGG